MIKIPPGGINALFCLHVAMRLKEKAFPHDSRVVVASLETSLGADFDGLMNLGLISAIAGPNYVPHLGEEGLYRPFQKRNGEPAEAEMLERFTPGQFSPDEQRVLETKLKSLVLKNQNDTIDRIRFFPNGKMDPQKEPDIEKMAKELKNFYANEQTIAGRLNVPQDYFTLKIIPLQVRLDYVKIWDAKGKLDWKVVCISSPGLPKDYLTIVPPP